MFGLFGQWLLAYSGCFLAEASYPGLAISTAICDVGKLMPSHISLNVRYPADSPVSLFSLESSSYVDMSFYPCAVLRSL